MNKKVVLGLFSVLMVTALVACGDDSSSASAPVENFVPVDPIPVDDQTESSSSINAAPNSSAHVSQDSLGNGNLESSSSAKVVLDVSSSSKVPNEIHCFEISNNTVVSPVRCDDGSFFETKGMFISFTEQERVKNQLYASNCSEIATLCFDYLDADGNMAGDCVPDIMCPTKKDTITLAEPSCGTAVYTEKCIDTEFEGETCDAIGCHPTDCFESQKGMEAYSCNGGSVMICDGFKWQYTNCAMPIIKSSSSNAANSSSSVILDQSSSSEWRAGECIDQEGDTRYDEMYEFQCKNGKWVIIGYRPGACVGDMDCGSSNVSTEQTRCKNVTVDDVKVEGSACSIAVDGYHKSEKGCEFFCYGSKWIYTPPPGAL